MKIVILFLFIISFLFSSEKTNITLQLNWLNQFQFAGYYVAKEKGFYSDVGLNVEINELKNKKELVHVIKEKRADFAVGRSSLILDKINGEDVVALAAIFQNSPLMLLTTDVENIKTINDVKNKSIMITPDAEFTASLTAMLNSNGIYKQDMNILNHSFNLDDLINKKTDLMSCYISNEPIRLDEKGIKYKIFHPKDYGFDFYSDILFTSSEFIKNNPNTTKKFYEATIRGWEYAFKNKIEAAEIIYEKYNTQKKSLISLIKEGEILEKLAIHPNDGKIGCLDKEKLEKILNTFKVLGLTKKSLDLDTFIYEDNHHKKITFEIAHEEKIIIIMFLIFTVTTFLLIVFFLKRIYSKRQLLSSVLNSSDDLIFYKDNRLRYVGFNESFMQSISKTKDEIVGKDDFELFENKFAKSFRDHDLKVLKQNKLIVDNQWMDVNGKLRLFQSKKMPFKFDTSNKIGILCTSRDITDLYEIQEKLKEQTVIDELTKTYNRKSFNERMEEKLEMYKRYNSTFCIALLDIDDFKYINDNYGHNIGDKVLIRICELIKENIRSTDLLFRIGGEEFIIIYPKNDLNEALISTEKIRKVIRNSEIIKDRRITISIGLTEVEKEDTQESMFKRVDELMYFSKKNGKDKITTLIN